MLSLRPLRRVALGLGRVLPPLLCLVLTTLGQELGELGDEAAVFIGDQVIDAVNCGGPAHTDIFGVKYREDNLPIGTASDHGRRFLMGRVPKDDQILYQTERYHTSDFAYNFKVPEEGQYVLVLKFSEVYFTAPTQKVFDVHVNGVPVLQEMDIFDRVGKAIAHDEHIPFAVRNGQLTVAGQSVDFSRKLSVQFVKGSADNPKINAMFVFKGAPDDVPKLPDMPQEEVELDEAEVRQRGPPDAQGAPPVSGESEEAASERRAKLASGPRTPDPYSAEDQTQLFIPIIVVVLAFFPVLFCLCKM